MFGDRINSFGRRNNSFNPAVFHDPVAMQTEWIPVKKGGTNIRTHEPFASGPDRLEFRATLAAKLFNLVFVLVGLGLAVGALFYDFSSSGSSSGNLKMPLVLFGLVFSGIGGYMLYSGMTPIVFDKKKRLFWKGRKEPGEVVEKGAYLKLEKIHALQIISEYCTSGSKNKTAFYSYELNLVLENGERINIIDHTHQDRLREDARTLASFLARPVWDAT